LDQAFESARNKCTVASGVCYAVAGCALIVITFKGVLDSTWLTQLLLKWWMKITPVWMPPIIGFFVPVLLIWICGILIPLSSGLIRVSPKWCLCRCIYVLTMIALILFFSGSSIVLFAASRVDVNQICNKGDFNSVSWVLNFATQTNWQSQLRSI